MISGTDNPHRLESLCHRALDPGVSFIVQAPAGSGKTELLIQRYLKLLSRVEQPEAVVAITFTKKAAAEMRARVMQALRSEAPPVTPHELVTWQLARDVLVRDRQAGWRLLENPSRLHVQTIDALCAHITRQMPWLAGFGAPPEITEKAEGLYREAARNTLRGVQQEEVEGTDGPISTLLLHLDNDFGVAERLIADMLEKRDQWLRHTGAQPDLGQVRAELEHSLEELILRKLSELHACFSTQVLQELIRAGDIPETPQNRSAWQALAELLLTKEGGWRKKLKTRISRASLGPLERDERLLATLQEVCRLPPARFEEPQWHVMEALIEILPRAVHALKMVFGERGTVDFAELAIRASGALGEIDAPSDLALSLGYRLEHILVDEFQDTSYTHFELLKKLTAGWDPGDGRTLFLVGDPMQSIYRFRQAEVGLFLRARQEGIGSLRLEPLTLGVNFRSTPELVNWVNDTFSTIFPRTEHIDSGAVTYTNSQAHRTEQSAAREPAIHAFLGESQAEEADRVVSLLGDSGTGTTAILVRARSHLTAIVAALRERRIRFQAIEIDQLGGRPLIQDLMALTFGLAHLADRIAWLAMLRAPWCGLRLEDLHAVASGDSGAVIWDLAQQRTKHLSEDAQTRLKRVFPVLDSALQQRGRAGLRNLVEQTWIRLGGPACVDSDSDLEDAAAYFDLLEGLEEAGDLGDFKALREQVQDLFAQPDSRAGGTLQVMTIHKAKGLEFDTVVLPGLGQRPRSDDTALLTWSEQEGKLLLAPIAEAGSRGNAICKYLGHLEKQKNDNETKRLLYVAVTRARDQLHLLGCAKLNDKGDPPSAHSGSLLELLWAVAGAHFIAKARTQPTLAFASNGASPQRIIHRVAEDWTVPAPPPEVFCKVESIESIEPPGITYEWAGDRPRHVGTVVHEYLRRIAREGIEAWHPSGRSAYRAMLAALGVPPSELQTACEGVESILSNALRDPKGRWVLSAHAEAESEYAVTGLIDGKVYRAVIDRTFIDEAGVRWIVDYKTSSHEGGDLETFLENEKLRYQEQLERYARLLSQSETRPMRLGLYFPLLNGWREWAAPTVKRRQATLFSLS
ncbi:MAG: UvrD-helicase domain-containing protein [Bryobacteraceae bacterium]